MKCAILCLLCICACVSCRPVQTGISPSSIANDPELNSLTADRGGTTNLIAVGDWSRPVKDETGYILRGRLLLFDAPHHTRPSNPIEKEWWGNQPLFLELQNLSPEKDKPLAVYFDLADGLECDLRDAHGKRVAFDPEGGIYSTFTRFTIQYWTIVPSDGAVRLRADPDVSSLQRYGLELVLNRQDRWLIPAGGTNDYFLSGTFSPPTNHPAPPGFHGWHGKLVLPPMKISLAKQ